MSFLQVVSNNLRQQPLQVMQQPQGQQQQQAPQMQAPVNLNPAANPVHPQPAVGSYANNIQPQGQFDQQQPQVGVTAYDLRGLQPSPLATYQQNLYAPNSQGTPFGSFDYSGNGNVPYHQPAYSGNGWMPSAMAKPIQQPNYPTLNHMRPM